MAELWQSVLPGFDLNICLIAAASAQLYKTLL